MRTLIIVLIALLLNGCYVKYFDDTQQKTFIKNYYKDYDKMKNELVYDDDIKRLIDEKTFEKMKEYFFSKDIRNYYNLSPWEVMTSEKLFYYQDDRLFFMCLGIDNIYKIVERVRQDGYKPKDDETMDFIYTQWIDTMPYYYFLELEKKYKKIDFRNYADEEKLKKFRLMYYNYIVGNPLSAGIGFFSSSYDIVNYTLSKDFLNPIAGLYYVLNENCYNESGINVKELFYLYVMKSKDILYEYLYLKGDYAKKYYKKFKNML